jgi:hypothetical protein
MTYESPTHECADCTRRVSEDSGEVMVGGFCEDCAPFHGLDVASRCSECCGTPYRSFDNNGYSAEWHVCESCGNRCDIEVVSPRVTGT